MKLYREDDLIDENLQNDYNLKIKSEADYNDK